MINGKHGLAFKSVCVFFPVIVRLSTQYISIRRYWSFAFTKNHYCTSYVFARCSSATFFGLFTMLIAFMASHLRSIVQASIATGGSFTGGVGGLFFLGVLFPWCGNRVCIPRVKYSD